MVDFVLGRIKFVWKGEWASNTIYLKDDVISRNGSSYVAITNHTSNTTNSNAAFASDLSTGRWNLMAQRGVDGDPNTPTTTYGDLIVRGNSSDLRLPVGTNGYALFVANGYPTWQAVGGSNNVYYVSEEGSDSNNGNSPTSAWATLKYACENVTGPAVIYVKPGLYNEILPIRVPSNVTIQGDGQRVSQISPINIRNTGADVNATTGAQTSTTVVISNATTIATTGSTWTVGARATITGIAGNATITNVASNIPSSGMTTLTVSFSSQTVAATSGSVIVDYSGATIDADTMFLLGDGSVLNKLFFSGMQGYTPSITSPEDAELATKGGIFVALDPNIPIVNKSPYILECAAFSTNGGIGAFVNGNVHNSGLRSMLFHGYTVVCDGGIGYWVHGKGKAELVSCFTYYCWMGYTTTAGGRIRSLNGNNSYGEYGSVSRGFDSTEPALTGLVYGRQLEFNSGSTMAFNTGEFIRGGTSSANGIITNVQSAANKLYYWPVSGNFQNNEVVTGQTTTVTATVSATGHTGQKGYVIVANRFSSEPKIGRSIQFSDDVNNAYVIGAISGTYTNSNSRMVIVLSQQKNDPSANGATVTIRENFSQTRLTGHDFLSVGTGGANTTNYPNTPTQQAQQTNEVIESFPGRVYYVSTDQDGNFRVGDYFKVDQATGRATLDASAFDLSGLTSLKLGSIGAQLGETINEFSSDATMGGNSNQAVPTEFAVKTYIDTKLFANTISYSNSNSGISASNVQFAIDRIGLDLSTTPVLNLSSANVVTNSTTGLITYYKDASIIVNNVVYNSNSVPTSWTETYNNVIFTYTVTYDSSNNVTNITRV